MKTNCFFLLPLTLILIVANLSTNSLKAQTQDVNFYELLNFLYENDSSLNVPDSLKSGSAKEIDRMNLIWGPRLSPDGDVSKAATAIVNYTNSYTGGYPETGCGLVTTNWKEEDLMGNVGNNRATKGNGQINRIAFDPRYGISSNTIYAASFYGGL